MADQRSRRRSIGLLIALLIIAVALLLSSCSADPCVSAPNSPSCHAQEAVANATIVAVNADTDARGRQAQMKATQDAIALQAQATQGAINSKATSDAVIMAATAGARRVEAEATQVAVRSKATSQAVEAAATQNAIGLKATAQAIQASATQTALEGQIKINQAQAQASAAGTREWILIGTVLALVIALAIFVGWYSRKTLRAGVHAVEVRASLVRYGANNSQMAIVTIGPSGSKNVFNLSQMIGPYANTDPTQMWDVISRLNLPDQMKALYFIEQAKRQKAVEMGYAIGVWPEIDSGDEPPQIAAPLAVNYPYVITTTSPTMEPVADWLDEVDTRLLAPPVK